MGDALDKVIRDGFMFQYFIKNAKYTNLFKNRWLRGFRSPVQYFIVNGYVSGDTEPQDTYPIWPEKYIFKCYNSNSIGSTLKDINSGHCESDSYDDNKGSNWFHNFKQYFVRQGWLTFSVFTGAILGLYYLYQGYLSIMPKPKPVAGTGTKKEIKALSVDNRAGEQDFKIIGVFNNKVVWSDNFKLKKGDMHHGLKVAKINPRSETIVFTAPNGKHFSLPFAGCRIKRQSQEVSHTSKRRQKRIKTK